MNVVDSDVHIKFVAPYIHVCDVIHTHIFCIYQIVASINGVYRNLHR